MDDSRGIDDHFGRRLDPDSTEDECQYRKHAVHGVYLLSYWTSYSHHLPAKSGVNETRAGNRRANWHPSTGDVIEAATRKIVAGLKDERGTDVHSEKLLEIDFRGDRPCRAGNQFGMGRVERR